MKHLLLVILALFTLLSSDIWLALCLNFSLVLVCFFVIFFVILKNIYILDWLDCFFCEMCNKNSGEPCEISTVFLRVNLFLKKMTLVVTSFLSASTRSRKWSSLTQCYGSPYFRFPLLRNCTEIRLGKLYICLSTTWLICSGWFLLGGATFLLSWILSFYLGFKV